MRVIAPGRIAVDATAIGSGRGGDETYMAGALEGLAAAEHDLELVVYHRPGVALPAGLLSDRRVEARPIPVRSGWHHYAVALPRRLRRDGASVAFSVTHGAVRGPAAVLTVCDLSFRQRPDLYRARTRLRLEATVPRQARAAAQVVTLSEFSRRAIISELGLDEDRVVVVPCVVPSPPQVPGDELDTARASLAVRGVREPYACYLGNLHPRKNVARLIEAFASARATAALDGYQLVVAGGRWWGGAAEAEAARRAPAGSVVSIGPVTSVEKEVLLRSATFLAYPSLYEGFGLPPVEAMARGTPVLAARATALPEVLGDAALLVDGLDVDAIAAGIVELAVDPQRRGELIERGYARVAAFSPARTGAQLAQVLAQTRT